MPTDSFNEHSVVCDKTAFKYYRTPPRYLGACPAPPLFEPDPRYRKLRTAPLITEVLGLPLHILTDDVKKRSHGETLRFHVIDPELRLGHTRETVHGFRLASPELTLFTLSRTLTFNQLVMAMYEMCGRFTLYEPTQRLEAELVMRNASELFDGWSRVVSESGKPTSLWSRPPLVSLAELKDFASEIEGTRGARLFSRAVDCVSGMTASPLEAQLSMLLWMSPNLGGRGYRNIQNNCHIKLSKSAGLLTDMHSAEVDLRVLSPDGTQEWMLECQGKAIHDRAGAGTKDALRATALQSMGLNVTMVTNSQIHDQDKFAVLLDMLSEKLGIPFPDKTGRQIIAENNLRTDIFGDWLALSNEPTPAELKARRLNNRARREHGHAPKC